jgi:hypothetical protein
MKCIINNSFWNLKILSEALQCEAFGLYVYLPNLPTAYAISSLI